MNITQEDLPISLKITKDRLKKFHDPELKNIYSKKMDNKPANNNNNK